MKVDSQDLLDSNDVAEILGLSSSTAVSTYRRRYPDFPEPLVVKGSGKCVLWERLAVETWARGRSLSDNQQAP
ncbi:MAG: helix-turn-helix transcriptional regulator [Acidimicrobiales bacterium]